MGCTSSSSNSVSIAMVGLDGAGKSTLVHKWKTGKLICPRPTIGFSMDTILYRDISFTILEVSGQPMCRPTWSDYFTLKQAIVFVVDASDQARLKEARHALHRMVATSEKEHSKLPLFIVGTKMDLPDSLDEITFMEVLKLWRIPPTRNWHFQIVNLVTERNLNDCLDWLIRQLKLSKAAR